jgi:hypothetical protein
MYFCDKLFLSGVFMDRTTFETINKGKRNFIILLISLSVCIGIVVGLFTNYKEEILVCSKIDDNCYVEKINMLNSKKRTDLIAVSNIQYVSFIPKNVSGNMYAKGYTSFYLSFVSKQKEKIKIFSTEYYEKDEVKDVVSNLQEQLKNNDVKVIKIIRKL